jgi:HEAT repeat protein
LFRPTIIEALGKIGSADAVKFILEKYKDEDEVTQYSMIESLGKIGNIEAFFFLISELKNMSYALTWAAIKSLKELKEAHNLDVPFDEHMRNSIMITLVDGDIEYKRAAASLISVFEDKKIVEACLKIYGEDSEIDEYIKAKFFENPVFLYPRLTEYMKQKPQNLKSLFDLLKDIIEFNSDSLASLSEIDMRNLCDMFADNIENPDEEIRRSAIEFLFFCSLDMAEMFIDTMLQDDNFWNRLRVLEILEGLGSEKLNEAAKILSEDPEEMVKEKALEIIQRNGISHTESKV